MATVRYTNLPQSDLSDTNQSADQKTKIFFNGFFEQEVVINGTEWDIVFNFFKELTLNDESAQALSEAVITSARNNDLNALDLVDDLKTMNNKIEVDQVLSMYFNQIRRNTSLLGYSQPLIGNVYITRNLLA